MERLKYILGSLFILLFNTLLYAQTLGDDEADDTPPTPGDNLTGPGMENNQTGGEGARSISIDMYEGILIGVAVLLIVGYIYYNYTQRSKKLLS